MLPRTMVGCSAKSYFSVEMARAWGPQVVAGAAEGAEGLFICPSFPLLPILLETFGTAGGLVGAQDVSPYPNGPYTGEVSAEVLAQLGVRLVMAGHPERRRLFGETDESVQKKVTAAISAELVPIVCIGETLAEREAGRTLAVLDRQIEVGLAGRAPAEIAALVIAYEPVWAIGTGKNATPAEADEAHRHIRARLGATFGAEAAAACRIQYGGSVKPDNIRALIALPDVDGALIGGASLDVRSFFAIVTGAIEGRAV